MGNSEKDAEAFYKRASKYYDEGTYDRAIADFTEAIRLKPDFVEAYQKRGDAWASGWTEIVDLEYHRDRADAAIADYSEVIRLKPDAESYNNRGDFYLHFTNDMGSAIADFTEAIRLAPDVPEYYKHRDDAYKNVGKLEDANADREMYTKLTKQ
jgi:tetratricopeptide (TPR) repeat protein